MKTCFSLQFVLLTLLLVRKTTSQQLRSKIEVKTSSGLIRGSKIKTSLGTVHQYLGIPFAKPPVGDLRFKKPVPVEPTGKLLRANVMPPACIQYIEYPFPWYDSEKGKSEDCLFLNIWVSTEVALEKRPVIFWIYGGGFTVGSNRQRVYDGRTLADGNGVIVVTINYRMGAFGFLTSDTEEAPGNVGMYDILEALKWVNKNIAAFTGDPERVTLAGQSAGSIAIGFLCVSPLAKGLFQRVIMESGSPAFLLAENNTVNIAESQKLAEALGCANDSNTIYDNPKVVVKCLRKKDPFDIAKTLNSFHPKSARSFFPQFGDELLPKNARIQLINGDFHDVDVLIGNNRDEGAFQITTANPEVFGFFGEKDPEVDKSYGESILRRTFSGFEDPDAVIQYYLGNVSDNDYDRIREQVYTAGGDYSLLCPTVYFAESYSKAGNNVYYYFFTHRPSTTKWAEWMGTVHFEEVQFVFGVPIQEPQNYTSAEIDLSKRMVEIWTNFAISGEPGSIEEDTLSAEIETSPPPNLVLGAINALKFEGLTNYLFREPEEFWPRYSRENPELVILDTVFSLGRGPHQNNCDFFRKYFGFN